MLVADNYIGHRDDSSIADRLADTASHRVILSDTDRRRSRIRTETDDGHDLGVIVARNLGNGDVLETKGGELVVVELASVEALVMKFTDISGPPITVLELGHAIGNRHWNLTVRGSEALIPVTDSRKGMEAIIEELLPEGVTTHYEVVPPTTFDDTGVDHSHGDDSHLNRHIHNDKSHDYSDSDSHAHLHDNDICTIDKDES